MILIVTCTVAHTDIVNVQLKTEFTVINQHIFITITAIAYCSVGIALPFTKRFYTTINLK